MHVKWHFNELFTTAFQLRVRGVRAQFQGTVNAAQPRADTQVSERRMQDDGWLAATDPKSDFKASLRGRFYREPK